MENETNQITVLIVGPPKSGKSTLQDTLLNPSMEFREAEYIESEGIIGTMTPIDLPSLGRTTFRLVTVSGTYYNSNRRIETVFRQIERSNYVIVTFDRRDRYQFEEAIEFVMLLNMSFLYQVIILVGTFSDAPADEIQVSEDEANAFMKGNVTKYYSISAKDKDGLERLFEQIARWEPIRKVYGIQRVKYSGWESIEEADS